MGGRETHLIGVGTTFLLLQRLCCHFLKHKKHFGEEKKEVRREPGTPGPSPGTESAKRSPGDVGQLPFPASVSLLRQWELKPHSLFHHISLPRVIVRCGLLLWETSVSQRSVSLLCKKNGLSSEQEARQKENQSCSGLPWSMREQ